jgi:hypothetical protein
MEVTKITKSFKYTINTILYAKFRNFFKRSLWKYIIASLLLAYGLSTLNRNTGLSVFNLFIIMFSGLILLSVTLMVVSSYLLFLKKRQDDLEITFRENEIEVFWILKDQREIKSWNWIKGAEESNCIYYLDLDVYPSNVIMLAKQRLSIEENDLFYSWLVSKGKLKI